MRGAPRRGLWRLIVRIRSRTSFGIAGRSCFPRRIFQVQNRRKPLRCHPTNCGRLQQTCLACGSATIAAIDKDRWEIELFFKALNQNLTLKTFVSTSENALRIQVWTALIAILLLKWLHYLSKAKWSLRIWLRCCAKPVYLSCLERLAG
jgi:IS4 transposase